MRVAARPTAGLLDDFCLAMIGIMIAYWTQLSSYWSTPSTWQAKASLPRCASRTNHRQFHQLEDDRLQPACLHSNAMSSACTDTATKIPTRTSPRSASMIAITRVPRDFGTRSPKPTVSAVMNAKYMPSSSEILSNFAISTPASTTKTANARNRPASSVIRCQWELRKSPATMI